MLMVAENIGRIGTLLIPVFYTFSFKRRFTASALTVAATALLIYYTAWARYFEDGRTNELMAAPLLGIPIPLAVAPVIFLLASAYLLVSWPLAAAAVWFGIFHIWITAFTL